MCISHDILNARTMARIVMDTALNEGSLRRRRPVMPEATRSVSGVED